MEWALLLLLLIILILFGYFIYSKKKALTFLLIAVIYFILSSDQIVRFDFLASPVPGWHTTIYSSNYLIEKYAFRIWLFLLVLIYHYFEKYIIKIKYSIFLIHLFATLLPVLYLLFPVNILFNNSSLNDREEIIKMYAQISTCMKIALMAFIIGQVLFLTYIINAWINRNKSIQHN